jgi:hypothetical protein
MRAHNTILMMIYFVYAYLCVTALKITVAKLLKTIPTGTKLASGTQFDAEKLCTYTRSIQQLLCANVHDMAHDKFFLHFIVLTHQQLVASEP